MLHRRRAEREHGQALVLFTLSLVVILAFAAIVVDLGMLRSNRQTLVNALDAGALAGGTLLPVSGLSGAHGETAANALIDATVRDNYPGTPGSDYNYTISYRCLIGVIGNTPDYNQITQGVCNPASTLGHTPGPTYPSDFTGAGSTRTSACDPSAHTGTTYDTCNVVLVTGDATTAYGFARVVGINSGNTGTIVSAACNGPCGSSPTKPTDLVIIIDRTASMTSGECATINCVGATISAAEAVLQVYNPAFERVALGLLGPSSKTSTCSSYALGSGVKASASNYGTDTTTNLSQWVPVGLSGIDTQTPLPLADTYSTGTNQPYTLASPTSSRLVAALNCFDAPGGTGTNLTTPIYMAKAILDADTRPNVIKGILLETDGQPNYTGTGDPQNYTCASANQAAQAAKDAGIKVYTVGFGLDGTHNVACPDNSSERATANLANMASSPATDVGCPTTFSGGVNNGGNFFCEPYSADLQSIFKYIAIDLASGGLHQIQLYPTPVVTAVSTDLPPNAVTITGKFLSGATSVTFGGTDYTITSNSDGSITATPPASPWTPPPPNTTVNVIVTTLGGSSPITSADQYTYK